MCEQCLEDWGAEIVDGIEAFLREWPDAEFGPAHIVLGDFNCEPWHTHWCLGLIAGELRRRGNMMNLSDPDEIMGAADLAGGQIGNRPDVYADCDDDELRATSAFLRSWLLPRAEKIMGEE